MFVNGCINRLPNAFGKVPEEQINTNKENVTETNNESSIDLPKEETEELFVEKKKKTFKKVPRVKILNKELIGSISLIGARIDDLTLVNYRKTLIQRVINQILKKINGGTTLFAQFG